MMQEQYYNANQAKVDIMVDKFIQYCKDRKIDNLYCGKKKIENWRRLSISVVGMKFENFRKLHP